MRSDPDADVAELVRPMSRWRRAWWWGWRLALLGVLAAAGLVFARVVGPHLMASGMLMLSGSPVQWSVDSSNWTAGGETDVQYNLKTWGYVPSDKRSLLEIRRLHRVTSLRLDRAPQLRGADFAILGALKDLRSLSVTRAIYEYGQGESSIHGPKLADADLDYLRPCTNLEFLNLKNQRALSDAGLAALAELPDLVELDLSGTRIGDEGLVHLARCRSLARLDLTNTDVTDAGLASLAAMRRLEWVNLEGTKVTKAGVDAWLGRALPAQVEVSYGLGPIPRVRGEPQELPE